MPRGVSLTDLIYDLRSEVGMSTNPAVSRSTRSRFIHIMNRVQRRLYADFEWPFLGISRDIQLQDGSRYYDFPDDIDYDQAVRIEVKHGGVWQKVGYKITNKELSNVDSDQDERLDPVLRWDYYLADGSEFQDPQIEVWPMPSSNGVASTKENYLRVFGTHTLTEMVNDTDKCLLDSDLIVLFAAAEILAKMRSPDAQAKLENANSHYAKLKSRATPSEPFKVGGDTFDPESGSRRDIELRVAYAGQESS